jgi:hypothetical protein
MNFDMARHAEHTRNGAFHPCRQACEPATEIENHHVVSPERKTAR